MEIWKDIKDYEGLYQVSNQGNVKSFKSDKEKLLKPGTNGKGYYMVTLWKNSKCKTFSVHRIVYEVFVGELIKGLVIDHINGITTQNNIDNLQQISNRKNVIKGERTKNGTSKYVGVAWSKSHNKWRSGIRINGIQKYLGVFNTEEEASAAYQAELSKINF